MSEPDTPTPASGPPSLDGGLLAPNLVGSAPPAEDWRARFDLKGRSLRQHAARGTVTNGLYVVFLSFLTFLRGFIIAGFLTRAEYGVWGILIVSLGTLLWLKQVGIGDKYIQQDEPDQELAFQKAFTLELMFTTCWVVLLAAAVPLIALVYGEPKLLAPGLVIILLLPAGVLQTPLWVYYRRMAFVKQRLLQAVDPVIGFVVAVTVAAAGGGYWAFAAGALAGAWSAAAVSLAFSPFKLRLRYDRGTLRSYVSFSWPLVVSGAASMVIAQAAVLSTQAALGLAAVGALTLSANLMNFTNQVDGVITGTLYPAICAVKDRTELLFESFVKSNRLALMCAVPYGIGISLFCSDLVQFGIGEKWRPAVLLLQIGGVVAALGHIGFNWDAYFRARGQTRPMAIASIVAAVTFLASLPLLFLYDLSGLAVAIGLQMVAHVLCRAYFLRRLFNGFAFAIHAMRAILPTIPAVAVVLLLRLVEPGGRTLASAVFELCAYLATAAIATWLLEGRLLREATKYLIAQRPAGAAG